MVDLRRGTARELFRNPASRADGGIGRPGSRAPVRRATVLHEIPNDMYGGVQENYAPYASRVTVAFSCCAGRVLTAEP